MIKAILSVAMRPGHETYALFAPKTEAIGQRIYHMLHDLANEGVFDSERTYTVVGLERDTAGTVRNTNVLIVLPPGDDHESLIRLIMTACALRLSYQIGRLDEPKNHSEFAQYSRKARARDN